MRRTLLGFVLGIVVAVAVPAKGGYTTSSYDESIGRALWSIAGSLTSGTQAQWQTAYWSRRQAKAQEQEVEQAREVARVLDEHVQATRELTKTIRRKQ